MTKIAVVEDDRQIAEAEKEGLERWGFSVVVCEKFDKVSDFVKEENPDMVLLDVMLPFNNGFFWCGEIRKFSSVPIVFVSSASDNMNIVLAMSVGGDDFIAKPFDMSVLAAKIKAVLRRVKNENNNDVYRGISLNAGAATLSYNGKSVELTKTELKITEMLINDGGNYVAKEKLMQRLWQNDDFIDENTLAVNINRLRKKLESIELADAVVTKKGLGYMLK